MEGLRQDLGVLRSVVVGVQRHGGEARNEHDLDVGVEFGGPARQFDSVHLGHDDVGQQQLEGLFAQAVIGRQAIIEGGHVEAGVLQGPHQEATHIIIVLRQQDF